MNDSVGHRESPPRHHIATTVPWDPTGESGEAERRMEGAWFGCIQRVLMRQSVCIYFVVELPNYYFPAYITNMCSFSTPIVNHNNSFGLAALT